MSLEAWRCPNGHVTHPYHPRCRTCGDAPTESVALDGLTGTVVTWTVATATPPGVRTPNPLAIVRFEVGGEAVTVIGGLTDASVEIGDPVVPVHVEEARDPSAGIRWPASQAWDGYRFAPA